MLALRDVVIVGATRTPIGKIRGALSSVRPDDLLAKVLQDIVSRTQIPLDDVGEVIAGCANQAGEDNRNVARMALLLAKFPVHIPALTVNRLCSSGLEAIIQATRMIALGEHQVVIASGVESMSRAPWVMGKPTQAYPSGQPEIYDSSLGWRFPNPALARLFPLESMGETGENVAERYEITRQDQDYYALTSHQKAVAARKQGIFKTEICPVVINHGKKDERIISDDEGPRADTSLEQLAQLKPAFRAGGTVTAGNSSSLNDGAAAVLLCSRSYAQAHGLTILASIHSYAAAGVDPRVMGIGPVPATLKALAKIGATAEDIDLVELNEAFAAQSLAVLRQLKIDEAKVNIYGGAIALGHPLGCSGVRIMTTLLTALKEQNRELGLATLCVGVGQGLSIIIKKE